MTIYMKEFLAVLKKSEYRFRIILEAIAFSLLINLPSLVEWFLWGPQSPLIFSEWDEPQYLPILYPHAEALWNFIASAQFLNTLSYVSSLLPWIPHQVGGVLLTLPALPLGMELTTLCLIWDLIFTAGAYALVRKCVIALGGDKFESIGASIIILAFPYFLNDFLPREPAIFSSYNIVSAAHNGYPSIPILRGPFTQPSLLFFWASILFVIRSLKNSEGSLSSPFLIGILVGLSLYFYFFAWLGLILFLPIFVLMVRPFSDFILSVKFLFLCGISCFLISLPGLFGLMYNFTPSQDPHYVIISYRGFYLSFYDITLGLIFFLLIRVTKDTLLCKCGIALTITKFLVMNLQGVLNAYLLPYHVALFYIDPFLIGLLAILFYRFFRDIRAKKIAVAATICVLAIDSYDLTRANAIKLSERTEVIENYRAINEHVPRNATILVNPYYSLEMTQPSDLYKPLMSSYWLETITKRRVLLNTPPPTPYESVEKELILSWAFLNRVDFLVPCSIEKPKLPGDIITGVHTKLELERSEICRIYQREFNENQLCALLKRHPFNFIFSSTLLPRRKGTAGEYASVIWSSNNEKAYLYEFDYEKALKDNCGR